ncbi:uncharacterized protein N7482_003485 [Penicillium canariense]|uniref:DUF7820 domain-containing protein n=1 Tax=Penicillium canariense TaxID=189055 RepID=A0A9W9LP73_9EURO|nr:uncharacterized protein N7482_003485 [Penicillium canariense]KAJ5167891.1 hypothetical protein N7482_003485 [Penicillium canariense]
MSGHISSDHSRSASRSSQNPRLSQGQAFEPMPRHSFGRTSRVSNPNVFSDEYSLEPIDADQIERAPSPASIASSTTLRSFNHPQKPASQTTTENENPFGDDARVSEEAHRSSLPQKGMGGFSSNRGSVASVNSPFAVQRNHSVSSRFSIPRAMSPYTGATGPSHPYAMYPQVGVSRSASAGSTSTIRQHDRPLGESNGPQHPYAMYPQNVVEEGMDDDVIPVGFPGHNPPYQPPPGRRDNDVGDIIGADGHAEPLPPYSRYPTGVVPKPPGAETLADLDVPADTHQLHSISRDQPTHQPISETSTRALVPESTGGTTAVDHDSDREGRAPLTGIMAFEEKLKRKGKKTACCGLPVWTLVLIATVMLIGGSIGGAIGGVIGGKRAAEHDRQAAAQSSGPYIVTVTATPQMDYSTMTSTPTNLKSVPTGHYLVPSQLQNSSKMCVEDDQFQRAWGCMDNPTNFDVVIGGESGHHSIVFSSVGPSSTFTYGAQPPILPTPTQSLGLAIDTSDTDLGPALFFFAKFDKLVIVPESQFEASSVSARSFVGDESFLAGLHRMQTAQPGDKPWFCYWNQTMMEFFIYVNQTVSDDSGSTTASTDSDMSASTASAQSNSRKREDSILDYPRKIKIEERRDFAGAQAPYCQQMQVGSDGNLVGPIQNQVINIKEREPTPTTTYINTNSGTQQTYTAQAQYATPCYCLSTTD